MKISQKFEDLTLKQLESFGCSMGVNHLVLYLASAKEGSKATFEMIAQWPKVDRLLVSIEDDPTCLLYTSPSPRDRTRSRMPSSA